VLPPLPTLPKLAHYSAAAGVVTAIPAIVTGTGEAYEMIRGQVKAKGSVRAVIHDAWNMKDDAGPPCRCQLVGLRSLPNTHNQVAWVQVPKPCSSDADCGAIGDRPARPSIL
jgi:hypothetical protein